MFGFCYSVTLFFFFKVVKESETFEDVEDSLGLVFLEVHNKCTGSVGCTIQSRTTKKRQAFSPVYDKGYPNPEMASHLGSGESKTTNGRQRVR